MLLLYISIVLICFVVSIVILLLFVLIPFVVFISLLLSIVFIGFVVRLLAAGVKVSGARREAFDSLRRQSGSGRKGRRALERTGRRTGRKTDTDADDPSAGDALAITERRHETARQTLDGAEATARGKRPGLRRSCPSGGSTTRCRGQG